MQDNAAISEPVEMSVELTIAWLSNTATRATPEDAVAFLKSSHAALVAISVPAPIVAAEDAGPVRGAVSERASLASSDHIVSMIDGRSYRTLRRHLRANGMTPEEYRRRYGLRDDYPMVAESYSEQRSRMAKSSGLGRKPGAKSAGSSEEAVKTA